MQEGFRLDMDRVALATGRLYIENLALQQQLEAAQAQLAQVAELAETAAQAAEDEEG